MVRDRSVAFRMAESATRATGLTLALLYAALIGWLYARQPQTIAQVTGGLTDAIGSYHVDERTFDDGLAFFRSDRFRGTGGLRARRSSGSRRPNPVLRRLSYYRQGWGRFYHDDALYREGLAAVNRAIALAPGGHYRRR